MYISISDFLKQMLIFFPAIENEYKGKDSYEGADTILIEDVIMPEVIVLLKKNSDKYLLKEVFDYFEKVSVSADDYLATVFSVTVLEILGNDSNILEIAKKYMGEKTTQLQLEADRAIGRPV